LRLLILPLTLCLATEAATNSPPPFQGPGTRRMAERLQKIARDADPAKDMFLSRQRTERLRAQIAAVDDPGQFLRLQQDLAAELLKAGQPAEALAAWQTVEARVREWGVPSNNKIRASVAVEKAICQFRIGEQANCVLNPTTESCLMPISP